MKLPTAKNWGVTRASFPEQDWSRWEAQRFSRPPDEATIDTSYWSVWPCCIHCATWICAGCWDFRRSRATRRADQYCPKCGSREGFFSAVRHGTRNPHGPHVRKLPFLVPVISDERASIVRQLEEALGDRLKARAAADRVFSTACPAGDPCPATGCPACCPTYDPCGEKSCRNCHPGGEMHVPEEAELTEGLTEEEARNRGYLPPKMGKCTYSCLEDGVNYPECPVHGGQELDILPHAVKTVSDKIREGHANGCVDTDRISMTIAEAQELCNLAVQNKYQDSDVIEASLRKVLAEAKKREVTDEDRKLIAQNAKASIERRDRERAERLLREMAMHHAVDIQKAILAAGNMPDRSLTETADAILKWLTDTAE